MLFLFDIDGTLLRRMPPAHRQAIADAARAVYDVALGPTDLGQTAGMTDTAIARRALLHAGVPDATIAQGLAQFFGVAADAYEQHVATDLRPYHTPHAAETLEWLAQHDAALGLVTGNVERIAWSKLRAAGLAQYFRCGAFGDEAEDRNALPPFALARARRAFGREFTPQQTYVIGDTPADVACGLASGMHAVGVATGPMHSVAELHASGATFAFEDLLGLRTLQWQPRT